MPLQRQIIGIGEALLAEYPDRIVPAGLAIEIALAAKRLGHDGVPISRLGQDDHAARIIDHLRERGVDTDHLQSDPDLATGTLLVRSIADRTTQQLSPKAAFDNLQWDFDLVDAAQQTDVVVFGMLAQRGGLSSSTVRRFIDECQHSLRICDLTNRETNQRSDRSMMRRLLDLAVSGESPCGAVLDEQAVTTLRPGNSSNDDGAMQTLLREHELTFAVCATPGQPVSVHDPESRAHASQQHCSAHHALTVVTLAHSLLAGKSLENAIAQLERVMEFARECADDDVPQELLQGEGRTGT